MSRNSDYVKMHRKRARAARELAEAGYPDVLHSAGEYVVSEANDGSHDMMIAKVGSDTHVIQLFELVPYTTAIPPTS